MIGYLLVAAGAAVGAPLRYLTDRVVQGRHRSIFPWGTLMVNVVGSAVFGAILAIAMTGSHHDLELLAGIGFCGAFTTYSTFSYETVRLAQKRAAWTALANTAASIVVGTLVAAAGFAFTRTLLT